MKLFLCTCFKQESGWSGLDKKVLLYALILHPFGWLVLQQLSNAVIERYNPSYRCPHI